jgi:hypothetical protein
MAKSAKSAKSAKNARKVAQERAESVGHGGMRLSAAVRRDVSTTLAEIQAG